MVDDESDSEMIAESSAIESDQLGVAVRLSTNDDAHDVMLERLLLIELSSEAVRVCELVTETTSVKLAESEKPMLVMLSAGLAV